MLTALKARPYNTWSRNIFPFSMEGCVLYLPFWQEDMQGTTLLSYDQYRRSCAVTEALWTSQGRSFNGVNAQIAIPASASFSLPHDYTFIAWVKQSTLAVEKHQFILAFTGVGNRIRWASRRNATGYYMAFYSDESATWIEANSMLPLDTWAFAALSIVNGGNSTFYVNGNAVETVTSQAQPTLATPSLLIGTEGSSFLQGSIGEIYVYISALTPFEIQRNYQVTKWRYQ